MKKKIDIDVALKIKDIAHILIFCSYAFLIFSAVIDKRFIIIFYIASCLLTLIYVWTNTFIRKIIVNNVRYLRNKSHNIDPSYYNKIFIDRLKIMDKNLKWKHSASDIGVVVASIVTSTAIIIYELLEFGKVASSMFIICYVYLFGTFVIELLDSYVDLVIVMNNKGSI